MHFLFLNVLFKRENDTEYKSDTQGPMCPWRHESCKCAPQFANRVEIEVAALEIKVAGTGCLSAKPAPCRAACLAE